MQRLQHEKRMEWIFGLSLIFILCLTHFVLAQDPAISEEPTALPADLLTATPMPSDQPTLEGSDIPQDSPTPILPESMEIPTLALTVVPTLEPTIVIITLEEPTLLPTSIIEPSATLAIASSTATIIIVPNATRLPQNSILSLTVMAGGLTQVYGAALACRVDPTLLAGTLAAPGDLFHFDQSIASDGGFQPGGQWILITRQMDGMPELGSVGVLWTLNYQIIGSGLTTIACQVQLMDQSGQALPIAATNFEMVVEGYPDVVKILPTIQEIVSPSLEVTEEIVVVETTPVLPEPTTDIATAIPTVDYVVIEPTLMPTGIAVNADVDGNGAINHTDGALIVANFGLSVPPALASADLNHDGIVNIYDLTLLSVNLPS